MPRHVVTCCKSLVHETVSGQKVRVISKINLFIVGDSPIIRERLDGLINEVGIEVAGVAKTGAEAIDRVAELLPAILILDIAMLGGSGFNFLQAVKLRPPTPLVIVLSNDPAYRPRSLAAGADYFFDKSAELDQLLVLLDHLARDAGAANG